MNSLGTEVGQKMRSAVKAKLIELGTGGSSGYIDDELPDYVMIMVANKRSKEQMIGDLNLFLGSNTELFVTWLHEVLQKLQEVTLPITVSQKLKRKASESEASSSKRERKEKKKEKNKKPADEAEPDESSGTSITDVFAEHLLQKARKNIEAGANARMKEHAKKEKSPIVRATDEFDIPTITEIAGQRAVEERRKELVELESIQNRINMAKRQLRAAESDESEDEDFLNIKEDPEEFDEEVQDKHNRKEKKRSPLVPQTKETEPDQDRRRRRHTPITFAENETSNERTPPLPRKRTIRDRLGHRTNENVVSLSTHRRVEKELYVPAFRRKEMEKEKIKDKKGDYVKTDRSIGEVPREKDQNKDRALEREKEKDHESNSETEKSHDRERDRCRDRDRLYKDKKRDERVSIRHRIGSRIIVAPPKTDCDADDEDIDRPISSIVKIKPRPPVSPSRQASKNLLLRAVAEAQRSTALIKPKKEINYSTETKLNDKNAKKSSRDRNRESLLKRATKDNIVIEVNAEQHALDRADSLSEDEYIPEPISDRGDSDTDYVYVPQTINSGNSEDDFDSRKMNPNVHRNRTQFVVTLDDKSQEKYVTKHKIRVVGKSVNGVEIKRLEINNEIVPTRSKSSVSGGKNSATVSSKLSPLKLPQKNSKKSEKSKESKKIKIKNDPQNDVTKEKRSKISPEVSLTPPPPDFIVQKKSPSKEKARTVSPIKFDIDQSLEKNSGSENQREKSQKNDAVTEIEADGQKQKILTKKLDSSKKYENLPELLSSISVESGGKPAKLKERCKYFPSCTKGESCEFVHPSTMCKLFPNCKFGDKCLYLHPKCKFDSTCSRTACTFAHTAVKTTGSAAPPLLSHVVPVQNYKTISATPLPALCKFYPNCTNALCNFYHPKLCRFGKNCANKVECNFYHFDLPIRDKFKWVASLG